MTTAPDRAPGAGRPSVVVTGAGRGIGEATARAFAAAGWRVGAFDLEPCAWAAEVPGVHTGALDVTDPDAWGAALESFADGGRLDVLVNNAGLLYGTPFVDGSFAQDRALVDVNVAGCLYGCRAAYPYLRRSGRAVVVNLCSASAIYGQPEMATYSATKFAVRGITEALDLEWAGDGIRVVAMWPLFVRTALIDGVHTGAMAGLGVHLGPDDVARAIVAEATGDGCCDGPLGVARRALGRLGVRGVHRPVGLQSAALYAAAQVAPSGLTRLAIRVLGG